MVSFDNHNLKWACDKHVLNGAKQLHIFRVSFSSKSDQKEGSLTQDMDIKVTNRTTKHVFPLKVSLSCLPGTYHI